MQVTPPKHKQVLTSACKHRADLEILNIQVAQHQGQLRHPDNPDKLLDSAAADKIRHYRARTIETDMWHSYQSHGLGLRIHGSVEDTKLSTNKQHSLSACMTTSGRIHGEFLRLLYFISNLCPGRGDARRPHCSASPRCSTSQSTALQL